MCCVDRLSRQTISDKSRHLGRWPPAPRATVHREKSQESLGACPDAPKADRRTARRSRRDARGAPVVSRRAKGKGPPAKIAQGPPGEIFANPYRVSIFCLWVWHAVKASLEGRMDAARTTAERLLRSPADAPQWSLLPGKSDLGYFPHDPACVIHKADACFLDRPV